jgi:hypothetical protein
MAAGATTDILKISVVFAGISTVPVRILKVSAGIFMVPFGGNSGAGGDINGVRDNHNCSSGDNNGTREDHNDFCDDRSCSCRNHHRDFRELLDPAGISVVPAAISVVSLTISIVPASISALGRAASSFSPRSQFISPRVRLLPAQLTRRQSGEKLLSRRIKLTNRAEAQDMPLRQVGWLIRLGSCRRVRTRFCTCAWNSRGSGGSLTKRAENARCSGVTSPPSRGGATRARSSGDAHKKTGDAWRKPRRRFSTPNHHTGMWSRYRWKCNKKLSVSTSISLAGVTMARARW